MAFGSLKEKFKAKVDAFNEKKQSREKQQNKARVARIRDLRKRRARQRISEGLKEKEAKLKAEVRGKTVGGKLLKAAGKAFDQATEPPKKKGKKAQGSGLSIAGDLKKPKGDEDGFRIV